jgi:hypothetical protein
MIAHKIVAAVRVHDNMVRFLKNVQVCAGACEYRGRVQRCGSKSSDVTDAGYATRCKWGDGGEEWVTRV